MQDDSAKVYTTKQKETFQLLLTSWYEVISSWFLDEHDALIPT